MLVCCCVCVGVVVFVVSFVAWFVLLLCWYVFVVACWYVMFSVGVGASDLAHFGVCCFVVVMLWLWW